MYYDELIESLVSPQYDQSYENILKSPIMQYNTQNMNNDINSESVVKDEKKEYVEGYIPLLNNKNNMKIPIVGENYILNKKRLEKYKFRTGIPVPENNNLVVNEQKDEKLPSIKKLLTDLTEMTQKWIKALEENKVIQTKLSIALENELETNNKLQQAKNEINQLKEQLNCEKNTVNDYDSELLTMQSQINKLTKERQSRLVEEKTKIDLLNDKIQELTSNNSILNDQVTQLMLDKARLQQSLHQK